MAVSTHYVPIHAVYCGQLVLVKLSLPMLGAKKGVHVDLGKFTRFPVAGFNA